MKIHLTGAMLLLASAHLVVGQDHDHSAAPTAAQISTARHKFSPELEKMKALAGRWEGTTTRASEGTNPAVMTYTITGGGSAVVETMFPGTKGEMTTVYHDDSKGRLTADHYCTAANQPKLRLVASKGEQLDFELSPDSDIVAGVEGHAHKLTVIIHADGTLQHDWMNHYLGNPAAERNFRLTRVK